jgi:hypothetical protein
MNGVVLVRAELDVLSSVEVLDIGYLGGPLTGSLGSKDGDVVGVAEKEGCTLRQRHSLAQESAFLLTNLLEGLVLGLWEQQIAEHSVRAAGDCVDDEIFVTQAGERVRRNLGDDHVVELHEVSEIHMSERISGPAPNLPSYKRSQSKYPKHGCSLGRSRIGRSTKLGLVSGRYFNSCKVVHTWTKRP